MARRIQYIDTPPLVAADLAAWMKIDDVDMQGNLVDTVILPGVIAQCEAKTGAAIRTAQFSESWDANRPSGSALDVGQAFAIDRIEYRDPSGAPLVLDEAAAEIQREQRESYVHFPSGRPGGRLLIEYRAGLDLDAYPSVRTWLLMQAATIYGQREILITGQTVAELPPTFIDSMLADITVPPRF